MARLEKNSLLLSGKVGNLVFRIRNGKVYISAAPKKYKKSNTKAAKAGREKFLFFIKMASAIQSNFILEVAWKNDPSAKGEVVNKLMKLYYKKVIDYDLSFINLAYCENPFMISQPGINFSGTAISALMAPLGSDQKISTLKTPVISAQGFIFLYNPVAKKKGKFFFVPVDSPDLPTNTSDELSFNFSMSNAHAKFVTSYPQRYLLFNLVLKSKSGKPMRFSNTVYCPLNIINGI